MSYIPGVRIFHKSTKNVSKTYRDKGNDASSQIIVKYVKSFHCGQNCQKILKNVQKKLGSYDCCARVEIVVFAVLQWKGLWRKKRFIPQNREITPKRNVEFCA